MERVKCECNKPLEEGGIAYVLTTVEVTQNDGAVWDYMRDCDVAIYCNACVPGENEE